MFCRPKNSDIARLRKRFSQEIGPLPKANPDKFNFTGVMEVHVLEGKHLKISDRIRRSADPFVTIQWNGDTRRTKTIRQNIVNPKWDQKCFFHVPPNASLFNLQVVVWDEDLNDNDLMGHALLPISIFPATGGRQWLRLQDKPLHDKATGELSGFVLVEIKFLEPKQVEMQFWGDFARLVDANNDGEITAEELKHLLRACGSQDVTDEQVKATLSNANHADASRSTCTIAELATMFADPANTTVQLKKNPLTGAPLPEDKSAAIAVLFCMIDREASNFLTETFPTAERASKGWFFSLTEWVLPGNYEIGHKPSAVNPIIVRNRETRIESEEFIPDGVFLAIRSMYQNNLAFKLFDDRALLNKMSNRLGIMYDKPASVENIPKFIDMYGIDMRESLLSQDQFKTFNEFFFRELKPGARPLFEPANPKAIVSAADCRLSVFPSTEEATRLWIKGKLFSIQSMLSNRVPGEDGATSSREGVQGVDPVAFEGGPMAIFRLAPQDYHRVHFPVGGTVRKIFPISGKLFTVNPVAVREPEVNVFTENKRTLVLLESPEFGLVCLVIVGATAVGSIVMLVQEGDVVKKGDSCNYFAYGGSTVIALFQSGKVEFDNDLVQASQDQVETYIRMGASLGKAL